MNKKEVIKLIGKDNWNTFTKWIRGQTVGLTKDGQYDYYEWDVKRFMEQIK